MLEEKMTKVKFVVNRFPMNTEEVYLIGSVKELGNWDINKAIKMQYYQNEDTPEEFICFVDLPQNSFIEYKFVNHKTWESVECGYVAEELPNRTITLKKAKTRTVVDEIKGFRIK